MLPASDIATRAHMHNDILTDLLEHVTAIVATLQALRSPS